MRYRRFGFGLPVCRRPASLEGVRRRLSYWKSCSWLGLSTLAALTAYGAHETVRYIDEAKISGLVEPIIYGNLERNLYILETTGTGVAALDFDNDGDVDLYFANGTRLTTSGDDAPRPLLYRNDAGNDAAPGGPLRFVEVGGDAGLTRTGWGQGVCAGDFDNDGDTDLAAAYFGRPSLWINQGDGTFEDGAAAAGLHAGPERWSAGCAFLDYDRDGALDLFFSNYVDLDLDKTPKPGEDPACNWKGIPVMCGPRGLPRARNQLFRNRGDGTFEDVSEKAGVLDPGGRYGLGVVAADFDNDGWTDLYVACDMTPSLLYRNRGDGTFEEMGGLAGVAFNVDGQLQAGMGVAVADYDGNGYLDIAKSNFSGDLPSLYRNDDGAFFEDAAQPAGLGVNQYLGWGTLFLDADEDSWPDLLLAHGHVYPEVDGSAIGERYRQPTILYRNLGDGRFADVSATAGPAFETPRAARGMAAADLDGDGRPEIAIANVNATPSLLRNTADAAGARLWIRLEGVESNRSAIGARVRVTAAGRTQIQDVIGGGSYFSQSDLALHFGLGAAEKIDALEVRWPSGREQRFEAVEPGRYRLTEGQPIQPLD